MVYGDHAETSAFLCRNSLHCSYGTAENDDPEVCVESLKKLKAAARFTSELTGLF